MLAMSWSKKKKTRLSRVKILMMCLRLAIAITS